MNIHARLGALRVASLCICGMVVASAAAAADTDSCTLLTPAQVSAAVGVKVGEGQHSAENYVRTCTWTPTASSDVKAVTLFSQAATAYDSGKRNTSAAGAKAGVAMSPASVGDEGYFLTIGGSQVSLFFKKGAESFKVSVYAKLPADKLQAMELVLAKQAIAKL